MTRGPHQLPPLARSEGLLIEHVGDETVVLDTESKQAHCLSPLAAAVFEGADGTTGVEDLAERISSDEPVSVQQVGAALAQLEERGLLGRPSERNLAPAARAEDRRGDGRGIGGADDHEHRHARARPGDGPIELRELGVRKRAGGRCLVRMHQHLPAQPGIPEYLELRALRRRRCAVLRLVRMPALPACEQCDRQWRVPVQRGLPVPRRPSARNLQVLAVVWPDLLSWMAARRVV